MTWRATTEPALAQSNARFYGLVALALGVAAVVAVLGVGAAIASWRAGRRTFGLAAAAMVPVAWLVMGYVVVGGQAESVSGGELARNLVVVVLLMAACLAGAWLSDAR